MAVNVSYRPAPPQLPPLRHLSLYPSHVTSMAISGVEKTTMTASGPASSSKKMSLSRPLPRPPAAASGEPRVPRPAIQHQNSSGPPSSYRASAIYNDIQPVLQPRRSIPHLRSSNYFMRSNLTPLVFAFQDPTVLHSVLCQLDWADAYNLFTSCKLLFALFETLALRDVILGHFIPEYAQSLRSRDMRFYKDIPATVLDLDLLLVSQRVALHRYPIHALKTQSSMLPALEDDVMTQRLIALTQAHSRFVLALQSLVHSSLESMPQEAEEGMARPRFSPIHTLRELTFPAPLAYSEPPPTPPKGIPAPTTKSSKHSRHRSAPIIPSLTSKRASYKIPSSPSNLSASPRPSADVTSSMISNGTSGHGLLLKKSRRLSFFGKKSSQLFSPPPPEEPRALRVYASTWRKTSYWGSHGDISDDPSFSGSPGGTLKRPQRIQQQRPRLGSTHGSSDSSLSNSSPPSQSRSRNSMFVQPEARATSPHDLILATSRVRAPILRVFVPCTKLEVDSASLVKCEQQLVDSGLWDHLSTGDIVCNLGFVPPVDDSGSSDGGDPNSGSSSGAGEFIMMRPGTSSGLANGSSSSPGGGNAYQKWLLFNGHVLVPYTPPDLLPLDQPLNLPTPFYYAHIMPSYTNQSYLIKQLPMCDDVPQLTLVNSTKKVRSPHSPNGYAMVRKYSWLARVVRMRAEGDGEMGEGWYGEWILEGEGTPEGKQLLINALRGYNIGHREWELAREKSGGGKLWLRLLTI